MTTKGKKNVGRNIPQEANEENNTPTQNNTIDTDTLSSILESGEFLVEGSVGGTKNWVELEHKPEHTQMLINEVDRYLNNRGYTDSFTKTVEGQSVTLATTRRDVKGESINKLIDKINDEYDGEEEPIRERLHIGTKQLSSDLSAFNNTMINMDIPHKWGVRKNTNYNVIKLQRIEGGN